MTEGCIILLLLRWVELPSEEGNHFLGNARGKQGVQAGWEMKMIKMIIFRGERIVGVVVIPW